MVVCTAPAEIGQLQGQRGPGCASRARQSAQQQQKSVSCKAGKGCSLASQMPNLVRFMHTKQCVKLLSCPAHFNNDAWSEMQHCLGRDRPLPGLLIMHTKALVTPILLV